jgi:hypothetical protein
MGIKRRQGNKTPQKAYNNIMEDLMKSEGDESTVAHLRRMIIRMFTDKTFNDKNVQ